MQLYFAFVLLAYCGFAAPNSIPGFYMNILNLLNGFPYLKSADLSLLEANHFIIRGFRICWGILLLDFFKIIFCQITAEMWNLYLLLLYVDSLNFIDYLNF